MINSLKKINITNILIVYFCYEFMSFIVFNSIPIGPNILFMTLLIVLIQQFTSVNKYIFNTELTLFFIFMGLSAFAVGYQLAFNEGLVDSKGIYSIRFIFIELLSIILWFFLGYFSERSTPSRILAVIAFLCTLPFWQYVIIEDLRFDYMPINIIFNRLDIDHLHFAEGVVVVAFYLLFVFSKNKIISVGIFIYFVALLYLLGGKASLLFFIATCLYIFILRLKKHRLIIVSFLLTGFLTIITIFYFEIKNELLNFIVLDGGSMIGRIIFLKNAVFNFEMYVPMGNVDFIVSNYNSVGGYSHNIFSLFQFFGVIPFFIAFYLAYSNISIVKNSLTEKFSFESSIFIYSVLSVLFAKSGTFFLYWFVLGFFSKNASFFWRKDND